MCASRVGEALGSLPRVGPCFRTGADGRIALIDDWPALLNAMHHAGRMALQTRHACARLVAFASLPETSLPPRPDRGLVRDSFGSLHCCFTRWDHAWGWLRQCECCGSPGRIQVHNAVGAEFLQLTAVPGGDAHDWSRFLSQLVASHAVERPEPASSGPKFTLPRLVGARVRLPFHAEGLLMLLRAFGDEGLPVRCTLRTAEVSHRRDIVPRTVLADDVLLHAGEAGASVQLALSMVREFALTSETDGYALHVVGADNAVLLTISAAAHAWGAATWQGALRAAFPGIK